MYNFIITIVNNLPVDCEVKTHKLNELRVVILDHFAEVGGPIQRWVDGSNWGL